MRGDNRGVNEDNSSLLSIFRKYIMYLLMITAIIAAMIFSTYTREKRDDKETNTKDIEPNIFKDYRLQIILGIILIFIIFLILAVKDSKDYQENKQKNQSANQKYYTHQVSKQQFQRNMQTTTERELEKLYSNPQYQRMMQEKGTNPVNWNWQSREKQRMTVWRDKAQSSDGESFTQPELNDE